MRRQLQPVLNGQTMFKNPYLDKAVILAPISDEIINDENLEPQMVRIRAQNNSYIFIDNEIRKDNVDPINLTLGANNTVLFARKIKRFAVVDFNMDWFVPNVNPRNNQLTFEYNVAGQRQTVIIPEGFYETESQLLDELILQLNTVTGTTGITFSYSQPQDGGGNTILKKCATITGAGGVFRFFSNQAGQEFTSPMIERGKHLINLSTNNVFTSTKTAGAINLKYTRYFDVESFALSQWTKNPNASNDLGATNILLRIFLTQVGPYAISFNTEIQNLRWCNYLSTQTLTNIDFQLRDEYGDFLYVPDCNNADGTKINLTWIVNLLTEI